MWTINNLLESDYVLERKGKIAGFVPGQGEFGIKLIPVTLEDILNRFPGGYVCNRDGHRSIPNTILYELGPKIELRNCGRVVKGDQLLESG